MNVTRLLRASRIVGPGAPGVVLGDRTVDYLALEMTAQRVARILSEQHRVGPGDRVGILLPDVPELAFVFYGVLWIGAVAVFGDPTAEPNTAVESLRDFGAELMIAWHAGAEAVERAEASASVDCLFVEPGEFSRLLAGVSPSSTVHDALDAELAAIHITPSGHRTLTHGELIARSRRLAHNAEIAPGDTVASTTPLERGQESLDVLNAVIATGASLVLFGEDAPQRTREDVLASGATLLVGPPAAIERVLSGDQPSPLRVYALPDAARPAAPGANPREVQEMVLHNPTAST